jgi:ribosomal 50S subunit-associated protein YjgA (DUF615 family)
MEFFEKSLDNLATYRYTACIMKAEYRQIRLNGKMLRRFDVCPIAHRTRSPLPGGPP